MENPGQPVTVRKGQDLVAPAVEERIVLDDQSCDALIDQSCKRGVDLGVCCRLLYNQLASIPTESPFALN
jgi:hypothetical protein